jgi:hypothetical protein
MIENSTMSVLIYIGVNERDQELLFSKNQIPYGSMQSIPINSLKEKDA